MALLCSIFSCFHTLFFANHIFSLYFNTLFMPPPEILFIKKFETRNSDVWDFEHPSSLYSYPPPPSEIIFIKKNRIKKFGRLGFRTSQVSDIRFSKIFIFFSLNIGHLVCQITDVFLQFFFSPKQKDQAFRSLYILSWDT